MINRADTGRPGARDEGDVMIQIGTKVRIIDPHSHYYGRIAWIEGDNQLAIAFAISINSPIVPEFYYHYYVITPDNQDIEHGYGAPSGIERVRDSQ